MGVVAPLSLSLSLSIAVLRRGSSTCRSAADVARAGAFAFCSRTVLKMNRTDCSKPRYVSNRDFCVSLHP